MRADLTHTGFLWLCRVDFDLDQLRRGHIELWAYGGWTTAQWLRTVFSVRKLLGWKTAEIRRVRLISGAHQ